MITLKQLKSKLEKDFGWENLESDDNKWFVDNLLKDTIQAIEVIRCCETLKDKYEIVFDDWLKDHKFEQSNNGFHKNGIEYKVNEITWMYIQDVYNL